MRNVRSPFSVNHIPISITRIIIDHRPSFKMKLALKYIAIASTATLVIATSCTSDTALPWPYTPDTPGADCNGDAICEGLVAEGQCNSLSLIDDEDTTCVQKLKLLKRAVDLDCTSNEQCFFFLDDSLLCLDQATSM